MTSASLLRQTRRGASLTQAGLAELAGVTQPLVARAETAERDARFSTIQRLAHAAGWSVAVLPTVAGTVADAAVSVADALSLGQDEVAFRVVVQLADDLASEHGAERVALTVAPPGPTGDVRFDAFIAGLAEHRLTEERLPLPRWLQGPQTTLAEPWFVDEWSVGDTATVEATPEPLRRRGIIIDATDLVSV